jgi:hypothetical protein
VGELYLGAGSALAAGTQMGSLKALLKSFFESNGNEDEIVMYTRVAKIEKKMKIKHRKDNRVFCVVASIDNSRQCVSIMLHYLKYDSVPGESDGVANLQKRRSWQLDDVNGLVGSFKNPGEYRLQFLTSTDPGMDEELRVLAHSEVGKLEFAAYLYHLDRQFIVPSGKGRQRVKRRREVPLKMENFDEKTLQVCVYPPSRTFPSPPRKIAITATTTIHSRTCQEPFLPPLLPPLPSSIPLPSPLPHHRLAHSFLPLYSNQSYQSEVEAKFGLRLKKFVHSLAAKQRSLPRTDRSTLSSPFPLPHTHKVPLTIYTHT